MNAPAESIPLALGAQRLANLVRLQRAYAVEEPTVGGRPLEAYVEVAARCNLSCVMCPITVDPRYAPGSGTSSLLSEEVFRAVESIAPSLKRVHLFGLGEPMLNPHLTDYIARLSEAGVEVWISTNATLIDGARADSLARAGLARVTVSIDGGTKDTYERIRKRGRFEDVIGGLQALASAKRRFGNPRLFLALVGMKSNIQEVPLLVDLCAELGGDGVFVEELYDWENADLHRVYMQEHLRDRASEVLDVLRRSKERAETLGVQFSTRLSGPVISETRSGPRPPDPGERDSAIGEMDSMLPFACSEPWATVNINTSGEVRTCCFNDTVLGKLTEQSLDEVWNGARYQELRRDHANRRVPGGCRNCVASGRVKQSPYFLGGASPEAADRYSRIDLELPADGDAVVRELVVAGRLPRFRALARFALPDIFLDETLVARLEDCAIDGDRFAQVIPVPFVTEGRHRLTLRRAGKGRPAVESRHVLVLGEPISSEPSVLVATDRIAIPVRLERRTRPPALRIDGRRADLHSWFCGRKAGGWLGLATVELHAVSPGSHSLELLFGDRTVRRSVTRFRP